MKNELILILDFGGQYNQLIARRVRECNVYSEVVPYNISIEKIKEKNPKGIIFTGGPASVFGDDSPKCADGIFDLGIPVLGICYGMQLMTYTLGGNVAKANKREYGTTNVNIDNSSLLFEGFENTNGFLMSHTDFVEKVPEGFKNIASTLSCPNAAMENQERKLYGIQIDYEDITKYEDKNIICFYWWKEQDESLRNSYIEYHFLRRINNVWFEKEGQDSLPSKFPSDLISFLFKEYDPKNKAFFIIE